MAEDEKVVLEEALENLREAAQRIRAVSNRMRATSMREDPNHGPVEAIAPSAPRQQEAPTTAQTTTVLPATGGLPLVPLAGASLLVLGVAGLAVWRRIS